MHRILIVACRVDCLARSLVHCARSELWVGLQELFFDVSLRSKHLQNTSFRPF